MCFYNTQNPKISLKKPKAPSVCATEGPRKPLEVLTYKTIVQRGEVHDTVSWKAFQEHIHKSKHKTDLQVFSSHPNPKISHKKPKTPSVCGLEPSKTTKAAEGPRGPFQEISVFLMVIHDCIQHLSITRTKCVLSHQNPNKNPLSAASSQAKQQRPQRVLEAHYR